MPAGLLDSGHVTAHQPRLIPAKGTTQINLCRRCLGPCENLRVAPGGAYSHSRVPQPQPNPQDQQPLSSLRGRKFVDVGSKLTKPPPAAPAPEPVSGLKALSRRRSAE